MKEERRIVIQHTDGNFYPYGDSTEDLDELFESVKDYPNECGFYPLNSLDDLNFPIGSLVYFQNIGWTKVVKEKEFYCCTGCCFTDENCCMPSDYCIKNKTIFIPFKNIVQEDIRQENSLINDMIAVAEVISSIPKEKEEYYIIDIYDYGFRSDPYDSLDKAKAQAELLAYDDMDGVFCICKVVSKCKCEQVIKWEE